MFLYTSGLLYASLLRHPSLRINKTRHGHTFQHTFLFLPCSMLRSFPRGSSCQQTILLPHLLSLSNWQNAAVSPICLLWSSKKPKAHEINVLWLCIAFTFPLHTSNFRLKSLHLCPEKSPEAWSDLWPLSLFSPHVMCVAHLNVGHTCWPVS